MYKKIKKLYKSTGKCDYHQRYKTIIESSKVQNTEGIKYNGTLTVFTSGINKNPSVRKYLFVKTYLSIF